MRGLPAALATLLGLLLSGGAGAQGQIGESDYATVNAALVQGHVLPRYESLASASSALDTVAATQCAQPNGHGLDELKIQFDAAMDAWLGIQHMQFGPVELFQRNFRFYFWPQGQGRVAGAVDALLAEPGEHSVSADTLAKGSVAVQGLPALEYLLFTGPNPLGHEPAANRRCRLMTAVAENLHSIAAGVIADWRGGQIAFVRRMAEPEPETGFFESHKDATLELFKSFYTGLQLIADVRLKPVLGESTEKAKPRLAESRLSGRSLRNIVISLEALQALYLGEGGEGLSALVTQSGGDPKLDPLMRKAFRKTLETARSIAPPLGEAVPDPVQRKRVETLAIQATAMKQIVETRVATALGLGVGFNALDGD